MPQLFEFIAYLTRLNSNPSRSSDPWVAARPSESLAEGPGGQVVTLTLTFALAPALCIAASPSCRRHCVIALTPSLACRRPRAVTDADSVHRLPEEEIEGAATLRLTRAATEAWRCNPPSARFSFDIAVVFNKSAKGRRRKAMVDPGRPRPTRWIYLRPHADPSRQGPQDLPASPPWRLRGQHHRRPLPRPRLRRCRRAQRHGGVLGRMSESYVAESVLLHAQEGAGAAAPATLDVAAAEPAPAQANSDSEAAAPEDAVEAEQLQPKTNLLNRVSEWLMSETRSGGQN
ncbi:hypothetical protein Taro_030829 [Colocasia esculenta]|uniref:Uncharacterized protein n=1 Tax=Colocasia esculenta TaxID=4460 RepID=A0A843VSY7_COLES|nr:hypothetical protein [Colocasia esculenta]